MTGAKEALSPEFGETVNWQRYNQEDKLVSIRRPFSMRNCIIRFDQCSLLFFQMEPENTVFSIMSILITASF